MPVNNRFNDLKNQIALAYEGRAEQWDDKLSTTHSIDEIFRQAQREFNAWRKLPAEERTADALLDRLDFDFFELLDSVTIARSRKHIEKYYDTSAIGRFPTRLAPDSPRPELTTLPGAMRPVSASMTSAFTASDAASRSNVKAFMRHLVQGGMGGPSFQRILMISILSMPQLDSRRKISKTWSPAVSLTETGEDGADVFGKSKCFVTSFS